MFYGPFWTKNSIVTVILQLDLIWTKKNAKIDSRSGQKGQKKVKFSKFYFLKTKTCFWSWISSAIQWYHSLSCKWAITLKKCIWMYDVIIGHYGKDKNIPFGGQKLSYRVETLHTGWRLLALQHIIRFLKILKFLDFVIIFLKKFWGQKFFGWNFWGQKSKIYKNPRYSFCRPCFSMYYPFLFAFDSKTLFLVNSQTFTFYRPKIAWSDVTKFDL